MFGLGISNAITLDNRKEFSTGSDSDELTEEAVSGIAWMTALRFYITQNWSTRIDFRANHYNADMAITSETDTEKRWSHYYNINVGLNYTF
jgi:opacity protein-like surface antigen